MVVCGLPSPANMTVLRRCLYVLRRPHNVRVHHGVRTHVAQLRYYLQRRGAKTKASINFSEEQVKKQPLIDNSSEKKTSVYPTVINQARLNMLKFDNCVLLTRVGGFYELYFEHAEEFGPQLNLKVAQKQTTAGAVSMAGFPFFQLDRFLRILVQDLHQYVAISEEFPNDAVAKVKTGGLLHDRRVARVVTPGTLIDENFMDPYSNNYVLSIYMVDLAVVPSSSTTNAVAGNNSGSISIETDVSGQSSTSTPVAPTIGLAWLDLSTGQFTSQSTDIGMLPAIISRVGPREIIVHRKFRNIDKDHPLYPVLEEEQQLVTYSQGFSTESSDNDFLDPNEIAFAKPRVDFGEEEIGAANLVLDYIKTRLQSTSVNLQPLKKYSSKETMIIDKSTLRALEIKSTLRDGNHKGTLLHAVRRTVTKSGARLLDEWLSAPSTSLDVINARLDLVTYMLDNPNIAEQVVRLLKQCHDSKRLVQKFALSRGTSDDLVALANTINATGRLWNVFARDKSSPLCISSIIGRIELERSTELADQIKAAINEEGLQQKHQAEDIEAGTIADLATQVANTEGTVADLEGVTLKARRKPTSIRAHYANEGNIWIMKPSASPTLLALHEELRTLGLKEEVLAVDLRIRLNVSTLSLRWTPGLGHICHVRLKPKEKMNAEEVRSVSSSKSTQSFHHTSWTALGKEIDQLKLRIRSEEQALFLSLREAVVLNLVALRSNASVLDELDIACSFATLASEQNLIRPLLNNSTSHKIIGGRHTTVETSLISSGRTFTTNDCFVGSPSPKIDGVEENLWLLTGPNMAGKSTFLRQNALITILAQIGSYVPCTYCSVGIVDAIYSRVGSADSLSNNQSTFMVEMLETSSILRKATSRSFVIMDEIGRGTTGEDGEAVAMASLWHLYFVNRSRTLFATHFHGLPDLCKEYGMDGVGYYCTSVVEDEGGAFSYDHKLRKGVNRESHALKVAKIAGIPDKAIKVAQEVLAREKLSQLAPVI